MTRYWLYMVGTILTEVLGTLAMRVAVGNDGFIGYAVMYVMLTISYTLLALAVQRIPLAVAYGMWECFGLVLITLCSAWLFDESLSTTKLLAIALLVGGIVLLESGAKDPHAQGGHDAA